MTKDDVRAAIGWVGVILLSPFLGALLYLVAGINRIQREFVGRRRARIEGRHGQPTEKVGDELSVDLPADPALAGMRRLGDHISAFPLTAGNQIELLKSGDEAYPAMLAAIRDAKYYIALASYIFDDDAIGHEFADALIGANQRGVAVRVLIDAVGARYSRPPIIHRLRNGGVRTALFMGQIIGFRLPYANLRNHRKILIVDGDLAFTGGMNIRAQFIHELAGGAPALDTHFRVAGPVVLQLMTVFANDWAFATREKLSRLPWTRASLPSRRKAKVCARVVPSGPDRMLATTHGMIMGAITMAQRRIRISSPYFLPDQQLIGVLTVAARRGIHVDIVIPSANNLKLVDYAMTAQLDQVVDAGCRVWRASGVFDHSKLMAVDGIWAYVGSSNLDPHSLRLNFELDLEIQNATTAEVIEARIEDQIRRARQETSLTLRKRPFWMRLRNRIIWLASPYL